MASINTYQLDSVIDPNDKVIGTDGTLGVDAGKTKNFTVASLQAYINNVPAPPLQLVITSGNTYANGTNLWTWEADQFSFVDTNEDWGFTITGESGFELIDSSGATTGRSRVGIQEVVVGNGSSFDTTILGSFATADRIIRLPNDSGTFALTSDLPEPGLWFAEFGTGINYQGGNVGIGTVSGGDALTVNGQISSTAIETSGILVEGNATIDDALTAGTVTATTLAGNLVGTIDTTTTGITQPSATDNELIATTAFVQDLVGSVVSGLQFQSGWDASTDDPDLSTATPSNGDFWIVKIPGSTNLSGIATWATGDWAIYIVPSGGGSSFWQKIDNTTIIAGAGTGNQVIKWGGVGASTTLTDSIITATATAVGINVLSPIAALEVGGEVIAQSLDIQTGALVQGSLTVDNSATITQALAVGLNAVVTGNVTSNSFIKQGGTGVQYLMADGTVSTSVGGGGVSVPQNRIPFGNSAGDGLDSTSDLSWVDADKKIRIINGAFGDTSVSKDYIRVQPTSSLGVTMTTRNSNPEIQFKKGAGISINLHASTVTANRDVVFQDSSGTIALLSDINATIDGVGTAGYISKWTDANTLQNSVLFELSDKIGLGTITPTAQLETTEDILVHGASVGLGTTTIPTSSGLYSAYLNNAVMGKNALQSNTTGYFNIAVGGEALLNNTEGVENTAVGIAALQDNTTGIKNTAMGYPALSNNTTGSYNTALGNRALPANTTGNNNTSIGGSSLHNSVTGEDNVAIGYGAMYFNINGDNNVAIGRSTGNETPNEAQVTQADNCVFIGKGTKPLNTATVNEIIIGALAEGLGTNTAVLGNTSITKTRLYGNVGIGTDAPTAQIHTTENILVNEVMSVGIGSTIYTPTDASYVSARKSVAIGQEALDSNQYGFHNVAIGYKAMTDTLGAVGVNNTSGGYSIAIGSWALQNNTYGRYNSAIGYKSLEYNTGTEELGDGSTNTAMGAFSLNRNRLGDSNTGFGASVLFSNRDGEKNTALGRSAGHYYFDTPNLGFLTNTNQGLFLGENSKALADNSVNEIVIGYDATGLGSNTTVLGNSSITKTRIHGSVGIGTDAPASSLEVASGDVEVSTVAKGFILKSPDGTRFRIAVANDGTLSASAV